ncbi:MAG: phospholipase D-like domain-containing protein [Lachnospiraceae bacterium]|nr:phospholipase D-like domain-containing protein [Lachnospiraceae bacterium]
MKAEDLKKHIPEIMRVMRILILLLLVFEYPIAGKCLVLLVFVEIAVGKGRYNEGLAIFINVALIYLTVFAGGSYIKVNLFVFVCMIALCIQLVMKLWAMALEKVDFIRNSERFTRDIHIKVRYIVLVMVVSISTVFTLAITPYSDMPEVSEGYKATFEVDSFYSDKVSCDRAMVIDDNGEALGRRISLIENAKTEIIMCAFNFKSDTSGKQMLAALLKAAERGVSVKLLLDGFNSLLYVEGNPYFMALARNENVEIKIYNEVSVFSPSKGMSRMHDKYIIADDEVYILGGRNTYDYFLGDQEGYKNYDRDVLVYNTGGLDSSIYNLKAYFMEMWLHEECEEWDAYLISGLLPSVHSAQRELNEVYRTMKAERTEWFEKPNYTNITVQTDKITLMSNPTNIYTKEPTVLYGLSQLMEKAKDEVVIHTPYVIVGEYMNEVLSNVCDNARVELVTNVAKNNDNMFGAVDYVIHKQEILDTGATILEYDGKGMYHAKSITIDDDISIVGSFDMDFKSTYHDTELMLVIDSCEFNERLKASHFNYENESNVAEVEEGEFGIVLESKGFGKMLQGVFIRMLDPHFRFLY